MQENSVSSKIELHVASSVESNASSASSQHVAEQVTISTCPVLAGPRIRIDLVVGVVSWKTCNMRCTSKSVLSR